MNRHEKLETINTIKMYLNLRGVGHTYSMIHGVKNNDTLVIVAHRQNEQEICRMAEKKIKCISLDEVNYKLRGQRLPLAIDNYALQHLLGYVFDIMEDLNAENNELKSEIREYKNRQPLRRTNKNE